MLRINLSSRPFYNERLVSFLIGLIAVIAVATTVVAVQQALSLSRTRTELRSAMARDEAAAAKADTEALEIQRAINAKALKGLALSTQQANTLIDERTFSWTVFFGLIEKTLPNDVRVTSVAPMIDKTGVLVVMTLISKRPEDLAKFIEGLQSTGAFYDVLPRQEDATDDGMRRTSLEARYLPPSRAAKPAAKPGDDKAAAPAAAPGTDTTKAPAPTTPSAPATSNKDAAKPSGPNKDAAKPAASATTKAPAPAPKTPAPKTTTPAGKTAPVTKKGGGR